MSFEFSSHLEQMPHDRHINNPSTVPNIGLRQEKWETVRSLLANLTTNNC
jgi:hypothetical protein